MTLNVVWWVGETELGGLLGSAALRYRQPRAGRRPGRRPEAAAGDRHDTQPEESPTGPFARNDQLARMEAVLFLANQPQSSRKLAQLADLPDGTRARTLVRQLNRLYDGEGSAFRVEEVAGGFQLLSRPKFAPWLRRLHPVSVEVRLSAPAMETLAVVAYRQPVLRAELEAIRGVQCGEILRQLMDRDLIRIVGRSEELGRPFLYGTTKRFLEVFGLRHLDQLPRGDLMRDPAEQDEEASHNDDSEGNAHQTKDVTQERLEAEQENDMKATVAGETQESMRNDQFKPFDEREPWVEQAEFLQDDQGDDEEEEYEDDEEEWEDDDEDWDDEDEEYEDDEELEDDEEEDGEEEDGEEEGDDEEPWEEVDEDDEEEDEDEDWDDEDWDEDEDEEWEDEDED